MARWIGGILCLIAGVGLLTTGLAWRYFFEPTAYWDTQQQQEYVQASRALKEAAYRPGRRASQPPDTQLITAQQRFEEVQAKLDRAIALRSYTGIAIAAVGVLLVAGGMWLIWTNRAAEPPEKTLHRVRGN
jgi:hypothetical protein